MISENMDAAVEFEPVTVTPGAGAPAIPRWAEADEYEVFFVFRVNGVSGSLTRAVCPLRPISYRVRGA